MQFAIVGVTESWILLMQRSQAGGHLLFFSLCIRDKRGVDVWFWIENSRQNHHAFRTAKRVSGMCILELYGGSDLARSQFVGQLTNSTV